MVVTVRIDLSEQDWQDASSWARIRQQESVKRGYQDRHGASTGYEAGLAIHKLGVAAEMAVARALGVPLAAPTVNTLKLPDLPGLDIQVRSAHQPHYRLIVRRGDASSERYVFATLTSEASRSFEIHGWCWGHEAKDPLYLEGPGGRPSAFFVPHAVLRPLETLVLDAPGVV